MNDQEEIWKDVEGYEGKYQVSNMGRVKSFKRYEKGLILFLSVNREGYMHIHLSKLKVRKCKKIHRLVAEAFIENLENKKTVNHKNGNKSDNRAENLEWATQGENNSHAYRTGLHRSLKGINHKQYKGKIQGFSPDGKLFIEFFGSTDIVNKGYERSTVYDCLAGRVKTHKGLTFKRIPHVDEDSKT